jgi:bifunctional DNA-binding transcriptional regulator/antitoxin component of YhaV-PrlF toxin-antitoxin module
MKLQQMNNRQFFITLPNQIIRAKGWGKGDVIEAKIDPKGNLLLVKRE